MNFLDNSSILSTVLLCIFSNISLSFESNNSLLSSCFYYLQLLLFAFLLDIKPFLLVFQKLFLKESMQTSSIICLWLEDNISSPVRYSYLSILPDDKAEIFTASLFIILRFFICNLIINCHDQFLYSFYKILSET